MKIEYLKKKRFLFLIRVLFLFQFSVIKMEITKNSSFNKLNNFYEKRFLTQAINDAYQTIITSNLQNYNFGDASEEISNNGYIFQLTTIANEEKILDGTNQNNQRLSIIDLGKCKSTLYGSDIDPDKPLILLKLEKETEFIYEKSIQFEIYNPNVKTKISNLEECKTFNLYIPVTVDEKLEKLYNSLKKEKYNLFDINDPFYNDICTPYKTLNGTDISLSDRKSYFKKEFGSQSNCKYLNYSSESKLMAFTCTIDKEDIDIENINKFNGGKALSDFYKNQKKSYLKFFKCYKSILKLKITKNFGSLIIIFIIVINLALAIVFIIKGISPLRLYAAKFIFIKPKNETHKAKENIDSVNAAPKKKKSKTIIMKHPTLKTPSENDEEEVSADKKSGNLEEHVHNRNKKRTKTAYKKKKYSSKTNNYTRKDRKSKTTTSKRKAIETTKNDIIEPIENENNNSANLNMNSLEDFELNNLELDKASQVDKRSFCRIFYSIIKRNQIILFTFFSWKDYNLWYFKFARFFFLFSTEIAMNALFFFDNSIHELFLSKGKFDFVKFILQIIISSLVSHVIDIVTRFFIMTDKDIYQIKELDNNEINKIMVSKTLKYINIKLSSFFIFIFVFMIVYFYLITSFCAIYENTQTILLINSIASFVIYLIYPILIYLLFTVFKYIGLKSNSSCMYKTGNIIPIF